MAGIGEKNYYQLLGVDKSATHEEIKEAYREIARVYHPDSNFFDEIIADDLPPESLDTFKAITAAYTTLASPEKRKQYNETLPPELNGWEENTQGHSREVVKPTNSFNPGSMGTFGSGAHSRPCRVDPGVYNVESVAEMISRRRSFRARFLSIFGL